MTKETNILLVEDNEGDIVLTLETFSELMLTNNINVIRDGDEAIQFLNKKAEYAHASTPDLIFLDINLPKIDGKEVLHYIKSQDHLKDIPVVMLTSSSSKRDKDECFNFKASFYQIKPLDAIGCLGVLKSLKNFKFLLLNQ